MQPSRDMLLESRELCRQLSAGASPDARAALEQMAADFQRRADVEPQQLHRPHGTAGRKVFWGATLLLTVAYFSAAYWLKAFDPTVTSPKVRGRIVGLNRPFIAAYRDSKVSAMAPDYWFGDIASSPSSPCRSAVRIYENDKLLGPNHATVRSIGTAGMGRSEHWRNSDAPVLYSSSSVFFFSSSDNTNPQTNGRSYWAVLPEEDDPVSVCPATDPALDEPEDDLFFSPPPPGQLAVLLGPSFVRRGNAASSFAVQPAELASALTECVDRVICASVEFYEDYVRLRAAQSTYPEVVEKGDGRFSIGPKSITFSATDNSDPNTNGKRYWAVIPYEQRRLEEPEDDLFFSPPPPGQFAIQLGPYFERHGNAAVTYQQPLKLQAAARVECSVAGMCSAVELYEDHTRLGPGNSTFAEVADEGHGRFAHGLKSITFSASDNSDPNTNGRKYWAVIPYQQKTAESPSTKHD